VGVSPPRR